MQNWRTTIIGAIFGSLGVGSQIYEAQAAQGKPNWTVLALSVGTALLGLMAKDAGQTGTAK